MNTYYHVISYAKEPATAYGFGVNEQGVVSSVPDNVSWMRGNKIDFILKFFEGKPAIVTEVIASQTKS